VKFLTQAKKHDENSQKEPYRETSANFVALRWRFPFELQVGIYDWTWHAELGRD